MVMAPHYLPVPDWFSTENAAIGIAVADLDRDGTDDLVMFMIDDPGGQNRGLYRVGRSLDAAGNVTGGWTPWVAVPDWFSLENAGGGIAVADVTGDGTQDLVVFMIDNPAQQNQGLYRIGRSLDVNGNVTGGWTPWVAVPDWFSFENAGGGIAVADVTGDGTQDLVVFMIDNPAQLNRGLYRIGKHLDPNGNVTGGWTPWTDVPDWFSWENQGGGVAVVDRGATKDLVVFAVDNPLAQNQAFYRVAASIDGDGNPAAGHDGWSGWLGVPGWFSWENQGASIAARVVAGRHELMVALVDNPPGANAGLYLSLPLDEDPATQGTWELLPYHSGVLAIHAAVLPPNGTVMFFAGSGNNQVRNASHDYGNVAKGIYTSVVWDPQAPAAGGGNFAHPDTINGPDGRPFDYFCGGDTFLPDGTLLSAGGNLAYPGKGRRDVVGFEPASQKWHHRGGMAQGRWYPTLLPLADGKVLAVSGLNENGTLNLLFEVYDPVTDHWHQLPVPQGGLFFGMPLYAHLFLLADGRVFFSGGRMDDPSPQGPVVLDLTTNPVTIVGVDGLPDPATRNQSASVMLPPVQAQRVMVIGGGPGDASNATGSTSVIDLTHPGHAFPAATAVEGAPMSLPRMHLNAVLLPDRTVFVSGGALAREDRVVARLQSELYDPATDTWQIGAAASVVRMYHSIALLLPDGRVVTAGGNPPPYGNQVPWEPPDPNEEQRLEVYSPPYLFRGPRPKISAVPTEWTHGQQVTITTPQAGDIRWAHLIRPGVTTHAFDNSQRLVDLPIGGQGGGGVQVTVPHEGTIAPPGWYMLFVVDHAGIPSVASWIQLQL
jgi:hypothetical protein